MLLNYILSAISFINCCWKYIGKKF